MSNTFAEIHEHDIFVSMEKMRFKEITAMIIGASLKVHQTLGNGFLEVIYQRALSMEFDKVGLWHKREVSLAIYYDGEVIGERRVDFLVQDKICVEIKAISKLEAVHLAQAKNYLEAFKMDVGLLINFGGPSLEFKRLENWVRAVNG